MGKDSKIGWTNNSWNPWIGCLKLSPACRECYAESWVNRFGGDFSKMRKVTSEQNWKEPIKWNRDAAEERKRYRVFCASLADVFEEWGGPMLNHEGAQLFNDRSNGHHWNRTEKIAKGMGEGAVTMDDVRKRVFTEFAPLPFLDKLFLTKRPQNIVPMIERIVGIEWWKENCAAQSWLGTTVENQEYAEKRIPELVKCRDLARVLFLSVEPMLGPVDLSRWLAIETDRNGKWRAESKFGLSPEVGWIIVGAESGPKRRPMDLAWARDLRDQCKAARVPFFCKQLEIDGKVTDDVAKFPEDLQIQEFPNVG